MHYHSIFPLKLQVKFPISQEINAGFFRRAGQNRKNQEAIYMQDPAFRTDLAMEAREAAG